MVKRQQINLKQIQVLYQACDYVVDFSFFRRYRTNLHLREVCRSQKTGGFAFSSLANNPKLIGETRNHHQGTNATCPSFRGDYFLM